jgi:translation initiation factor 1 (eIF-1/SUI1)
VERGVSIVTENPKLMLAAIVALLRRCGGEATITEGEINLAGDLMSRLSPDGLQLKIAEVAKPQ